MVIDHPVNVHSPRGDLIARSVTPSLHEGEEWCRGFIVWTWWGCRGVIVWTWGCIIIKSIFLPESHHLRMKGCPVTVQVISAWKSCYCIESIRFNIIVNLFTLDQISANRGTDSRFVLEILKASNLGQVEARYLKPKIVFSRNTNTSPVGNRSNTL